MEFKDAENKHLSAGLIRELDSEQLEAELREMEEALFRLRFRAATEPMEGENTSRFKILSRNIARTKTVLRERELEG